MVNFIQNTIEKYSELFYTIFFGICFIFCLNNYSEDTNESIFWLYAMIVCFLIGSYYFLNFFSKFMDKFESISLFSRINQPIKPLTLTIIYITALSLNAVISWINSTSIESFSDYFAEGLFIIQIVLLFSITKDLSEYLTRSSTIKSVAYHEEKVSQISNNGSTIDKSDDDETPHFFKRNPSILLNILNFSLFIFSFNFFS